MTFKANDGTTSSENGFIAILVNSVNDPPLAVSDTLALEEDSSIPFFVSGSDIESTDLTYFLGTLQTIGKIYQTSDGTTKGREIASGDTITNNEQKMIFEAQEDAYGLSLIHI